MSLINHDGDSLDCGNFVSDVFDVNIRILWRCDDDNITQISNLPKGVILERVAKKRDIKLNKFIICCLYQNSIFFKNSPTCPKSII